MSESQAQEVEPELGDVTPQSEPPNHAPMPAANLPDADEIRRESVARKLGLAATICGVGVAMGLVAYWPNKTWSAAWGNFFGALIVALGGLIGCLHAARLVPERILSWSWSLVVVGGFVIAGASLKAALT
jgi:hypothetical protein